MQDDDFEMKVMTEFSPEIIKQSIMCGDPSLISDATQKIIKLQDDAVREAMSKLGYLDPKEAIDLTCKVEALTKTVDAYMVKVSEQEEEIERLREQNKELLESLDCAIGLAQLTDKDFDENERKNNATLQRFIRIVNKCNESTKAISR